MSVTLRGIDRAAHTPMAAVSPAEDVASGVWWVGDTMPNGGDVAVGELDVGPGFTGTLKLTLIAPGVSTGNSSVKLFRRYVDAGGNMLSEFASAALTVDAVPAEHTLALSAAPAGTAKMVYGLQSAMNPPGEPVRANLFPDPRSVALTYFDDRYGWGLVNGTHGSDIGGVAGLRTYASSINSNGGGSGSGRGIDIFEATDFAAPRTNKRGLSVVPGQVITVSAWVYATKACTMQASARGYTGTTWSAAAVNGSATALAANTWTQVSVTITVPAGATDLCATIMTTASVSWVANDEVRVSGVMFEEAGSPGVYFDGTTKNGIAAPSSVRWAGDENNSTSLLYASNTPGATTVQAQGSSLEYEAAAEELIDAALERSLRRSVADVWGTAQALITAGTPGMLQGQLTYLCTTLAQALAVDAVYRMGGLVTLDSDDELNGLQHRATGTSRLSPERLPGKQARWLLVVEFREQRDN